MRLLKQSVAESHEKAAFAYLIKPAAVPLQKNPRLRKDRATGRVTVRSQEATVEAGHEVLAWHEWNCATGLGDEPGIARNGQGVILSRDQAADRFGNAGQRSDMGQAFHAVSQQECRRTLSMEDTGELPAQICDVTDALTEALPQKRWVLVRRIAG